MDICDRCQGAFRTSKLFHIGEGVLMCAECHKANWLESNPLYADRYPGPSDAEEVQ